MLSAYQAVSTPRDGAVDGLKRIVFDFLMLIPPGKRHFHAAINDSWFAHIAISVNPDAGTTNWFEKVSDEEYLAAIAEALENGTIREAGDTMFPIGEEFEAEGYTGTIHKNVLVEYEDVYNCRRLIISRWKRAREQHGIHTKADK